VPSLAPRGCHALQSHANLLHSHRHGRSRFTTIQQRTRHIILPATIERAGDESTIEEEDDETLLESIDPSTLQNLCEQYSLSTSGTKQEMLDRLREFANEQANLDRQRRKGRSQRVEANLEGKARHTIMEQDAFFGGNEDGDEEEDEEEMQGYFYYAAAETPIEKQQREQEERKKQKQKMELARKKSTEHITAPPVPPENAKVNEKGERVVTVYSTTDKNDLTGMAAQTPLADSMSLDNVRYNQKSTTFREDRPEDSLVGGPFGDTTGARRKKADASRNEGAQEVLRQVVRELLATTGAPAFQDDDDADDDDEMKTMAFSSPYGFTGFQPERIPPDVLSRSSAALRANNGIVLKEVLSDYELQAIGHDGMAADDISKGGGHYREVVKVGSFLEGYRKAEERRVARETSTLLLDRLVKEGVKGLDALLAGMVREGDDVNYADGAGGAGELNGALVRYLEEAIREQEKRVKQTTLSMNERNGDNHLLQEGASDVKDEEVDLVWNVTRGEDGTVIETIDPNDPAVGRMLREELEKTNNGDIDGAMNGVNALVTMTVQEKMLLLLKLLRDRVRVEAVIGNDEHARNLRILAYCLKAANDEERHQLILEELGNSLDSLDIFSDLVTASIDFAEARSNDEFAPGGGQKAISPLLNISKLQKVKVVVERIKAQQSWKASGVQ